MNDRIHKLGAYFVAFNVQERACISFETFIRLVMTDQWDADMMSKSDQPYSTDKAFEPMKEEQLA